MTIGSAYVRLGKNNYASTSQNPAIGRDAVCGAARPILLQFTPRHIGLPEPGEREARGMPLAWAPFRVKWAAFVHGWANAVEAGLTGGLGLGLLPPKWRDLDLVSESFIASVAPKVGETYVGTVPLGGRNWPLPRGEWMVLAMVPRMEGHEAVEDQVYLAYLSSSGLEGVVSLALTRPDMPLAVAPVLNVVPATCDQGRLFGERVRLECQYIDFIAPQDAMAIASEPGLRAAFGDLRQRKVELPSTLLAAAIRLGDRHDLLIARYYLNPELAGIPRPQKVERLENDWNKYNLPRYVDKQVYLARVKAWLARWNEIVRLAWKEQAVAVNDDDRELPE